MRQLLSVSAAVALAAFLTAPAHADDDGVQAVLDKAIKAHGGGQKIDKNRAVQTKTKGTLHLLNGLPFTQEVKAQMPGQFREAMELDVNGQKVNVVTVFDRDKGWISINGMTKDLEDKILTEIKEAANLLRIARLTALKTDKAFTLSPLGETKVNDKPAVGVKVATKGFRDVNLYFYKDDGLLAKVERRALDVQNNQEVNEERIITDYQDVDGLKAAKKVVVNRDGKKFMEAEVTEVKYTDKLDDSEFGKP
jgi:hypothetical protein